MTEKCCNNLECKNLSCNSIKFKNVEEIDEVNINNLYLKIMSFVKELNNIYGEKIISIRLYDKLLKKTYEIAYENSIKDLSNEQKRIAINKQITVFLEFCKTNVEAISNNSFEFINYEIKFSDKAYINLKEIMDNTIMEEKEETILTILSYFNLFSFLLTDNEVFKNNINNQPNENHESMFLEKFRKRIDDNFKEQTFDDPLQATMSLFNSGLFSEMLESMKSDINEGKLSIPKLLGSVQGMVKQLNGDENPSNNSNEMPDLNNIMGNVSNMLGGLPVENLLGMMSGISNQEMLDMSEMANMINNLNIKK
jgi:hypothetical protein